MPSTPFQLLVEFVLFSVGPDSIQDAKDRRVDILVVKKYEMVLPEWREDDICGEHTKKPISYTEDAMVQKIYLLNSNLLPLILENTSTLGWSRWQEYHDPIFYPVGDMTHDDIIRKLATIGEVNDLLMRKITPHCATA